VRFAFSEDQLAFRDAVRDLLAAQCTPEVVRASWPEDAPEGAGARAPVGDDGVEPGDRVWATLAEMGVLGVAVPEEAGGLGLGELDWVLLAEETGYAALPFPFVETVGVVAPLLAAHGDPAGHVEALLEGTSVATARLLGDGPVPFGQWAEHALLLADDGNEDPALVLTPLRPDNVHPLPGVDGSRGLAEVGWLNPLRITSDEAEVELAFRRGVLGTAAQLVGLARRMLDITVGYVTERQQFGVPIGSFQAVKHHLADCRLELEFAAPAVYRAAWSLATGAPTAGRDVAMAKVLASDAADLTCRHSLQCHGAIGYTVEYDLHLYLKRAWALSSTWGDASFHRNVVGLALGV
jgi:alkylation response protein AidB-like acyl-CoA dehydrogenase